MTLARLIAENRHLFYAPQDPWWEAEPFLQIALPRNRHKVLPQVMDGIRPPDNMAGLPHAVELAQLYVEYPEDAIWENYLWTCDFDTHGQRIFVGDNGLGLEIHRHLHLTRRWCVPVWGEAA